MPWLILIFVLLIGTPLVSLLELIVSLIRYRRTPKEDTVNRKRFRFNAIVAGVILATFTAVIGCLMILFAQAITYM